MQIASFAVVAGEQLGPSVLCCSLHHGAAEYSQHPFRRGPVPRFE